MAEATGEDVRTALPAEVMQPPIGAGASHVPALAQAGAHDAWV